MIWLLLSRALSRSPSPSQGIHSMIVERKEKKKYHGFFLFPSLPLVCNTWLTEKTGRKYWSEFWWMVVEWKRCYRWAIERYTRTIEISAWSSCATSRAGKDFAHLGASTLTLNVFIISDVEFVHNYECTCTQFSPGGKIANDSISECIHFDHHLSIGHRIESSADDEDRQLLSGENLGQRKFCCGEISATLWYTTESKSSLNEGTTTLIDHLGCDQNHRQISSSTERSSEIGTWNLRDEIVESSEYYSSLSSALIFFFSSIFITHRQISVVVQGDGVEKFDLFSYWICRTRWIVG